jgi:SP family galactose:H+ symporter-like MFS transporter
MVYITCFAFSMGPIAWIIVAEVFPLRLRGRGVAAATLGSGISNFLVSLTFLSLIKAAGQQRHVLHLWMLLHPHASVFVRFIMPETKGCELESISSPETAAVP